MLRAKATTARSLGPQRLGMSTRAPSEERMTCMCQCMPCMNARTCGAHRMEGDAPAREALSQSGWLGHHEAPRTCFPLRRPYAWSSGTPTAALAITACLLLACARRAGWQAPPRVVENANTCIARMCALFVKHCGTVL